MGNRAHADTLNYNGSDRAAMHANRAKEKDEVKPATTQKERAEKFQWTEVAPVDLDRYGRRAGDIITQGASRRTPKKPRRRR
jgi:hypothetical protein